MGYELLKASTNLEKLGFLKMIVLDAKRVLAAASGLPNTRPRDAFHTFASSLYSNYSKLLYLPSI